MMTVRPGTVVRLETSAYVVSWVTAMSAPGEPPALPDGFAAAGPACVVGVGPDGAFWVAPVVQAAEA